MSACNVRMFGSRQEVAATPPFARAHLSFAAVPRERASRQAPGHNRTAQQDSTQAKRGARSWRQFVRPGCDKMAVWSACEAGLCACVMCPLRF